MDRREPMAVPGVIARRQWMRRPQLVINECMLAFARLQCTAAVPAAQHGQVIGVVLFSRCSSCECKVRTPMQPEPLAVKTYSVSADSSCRIFRSTQAVQPRIPDSHIKLNGKESLQRTLAMLRTKAEVHLSLRAWKHCLNRAVGYLLRSELTPRATTVFHCTHFRRIPRQLGHLN